MNKKLLTGIIALSAISLVAAAYVVSTFVITTDVYEPFEVQYAIIGDAGNWDGVTDCDTYAGLWMDGADIDVGGLYPGEGRYICTKINNLGEGDLDYTFSGEVVAGNGNFEECEYAFGNPSITGTVSGLSEVKDGTSIIVPGDATPVEDCAITLSVTRG